MAGTAEDRAGAVIHQHEIGHIDGKALARQQRMVDREAGVVALLFGGFDGLFAGAEPVALGDEGGQGRVVLGEVGGEGMVRRKRAERHAEERVGTGGEDLEAVTVEILTAADGIADPGALGSPDPVVLHQADLFRPALQALEGGQELVGIGRDPEHPLRQLALFHHFARTPAAAVDDLLVGQNGLVDRVPVDPRFLAVGQSGREEVQEHLLLVAVILGMAGGDLPLPVDRQAHALELAAHHRDVVPGPLAGVYAFGHGGVLSRQAESVPAHRVQDVEPPGPLEAGDDVADGIIPYVSHVDAPRGIGEHLQDIVLGPCRVGRHGKTAGVLPGLLPLGLAVLDVVAGDGLTHAC